MHVIGHYHPGVDMERRPVSRMPHGLAQGADPSNQQAAASVDKVHREKIRSAEYRLRR
jgi:hypothetical protein